MPNLTENYNLKKPLPEEFYNVEDQNKNMEIIDAELLTRVPVLAKYYSPQTGGGMSADDLTVPFALIPVSSEINAELYAIVGGTFAWVRTYFYIETSVTARRMQIAVSYNTVNQRMAFRTYGSSGWQPWEAVGLASKIPTKASDVGAFPSSGGTLTGQMTIKKYDNGYTRLTKNHSDTNDYGTVLTDCDGDGKTVDIVTRARENKAYFRDNDSVYHELYHAGNLPNASDMNALLSTLPIITDANESITTPDTCIKIERWTKDTLNTPYKAGLVTNTEGVIITAASNNLYATQLAFPLGGRRLFIRPYLTGSTFDWSEFGDFKSDGSRAITGKVLNMFDGKGSFEATADTVAMRSRVTANDDTNSTSLMLDRAYTLTRKLFLRVTQDGSNADYNLFGEHNKPTADEVEAGTFAGQVVANSGGQDAGTSLLRNSKLVSAETNPTVNGEICWTYK